MPQRRRERPLLNGGHGALVESRAESAAYLYIGYKTLCRDNHGQKDLALETSPACAVGVIGGHFPQQSWWCDPASRSIGPAAGATPVTGADPSAGALADPCAVAYAAPVACATAVVYRARRCDDPVEQPRDVTAVCSDCGDRHQQRRQRLPHQGRRWRGSRCRARWSGFGRVPAWQRATDRIRSFALGCRWWGACAQAASAAPSAWTRFGQEHELYEIGRGPPAGPLALRPRPSRAGGPAPRRARIQRRAGRRQPSDREAWSQSWVTRAG